MAESRAEILNVTLADTGFPGAQRLKRLPGMWETWVRPLGREDLGGTRSSSADLLGDVMQLRHFPVPVFVFSQLFTLYHPYFL